MAVMNAPYIKSFPNNNGIEELEELFPELRIGKENPKIQ